MELNWSSGQLAEGLRCYRAEEFFLAHEHWEGVWLNSEEPEKTFLQSLIQIAAALHHLQHGNRQGAESLLRRAQRKIDPIALFCGGIMLGPIRDDIEDWLGALEIPKGPLPSSFPRISPSSHSDDLP
jgi:hypothetical protein